jgi:hypothetical protein
MGSEIFLGEDSQRAAPAVEARSLDEVFSLAYEELRRLARSVRRSDPRASLTPTTIVNEAWIKLARTPAVAASSPRRARCGRCWWMPREDGRRRCAAAGRSM